MLGRHKKHIMKRYGNLYSQITCKENLKLAIQNGAKGKRKYPEVIEVMKDIDGYVDKLYDLLINEEYYCSKYITFLKKDKGKLREIFKLPFFPDRVIQHAIMQITEPFWKKSLISQTYQAIKGRGVHSCMKKVKYAVQTAQMPYCLQIDVKKFYPSINNNILKKVIRAKIKCKQTLELIDRIINGSIGVPIGNYISQFFGNLYLSAMDHMMKSVYRVKYYFRYCDDIIILHWSKNQLRLYLWYMRDWLRKVKLAVKEDHQIYQINKDRGVNCLGFVIFADKVKLRRRIANNFIKCLNTMLSRRLFCPNAISSYFGWFKHSDSLGLWKASIAKIAYAARNSPIVIECLESFTNKLGVRYAPIH